MAVSQNELDSFRRFVTRRLNGGGVDLSLEDCLFQWRAQQEYAETIVSVQRGVEDIEAGRYHTLDELDQHIREELGVSPRPQ